MPVVNLAFLSGVADPDVFYRGCITIAEFVGYGLCNDVVAHPQGYASCTVSVRPHKLYSPASQRSRCFLSGFQIFPMHRETPLRLTNPDFIGIRDLHPLDNQ